MDSTISPEAESSAALFGLTAAVAGNAVIGVSQCLQKYALNRLPENKPRWHDILWILGITFNLLGELFGNFIALSYVSAAVVAPLGAVALVVNGVLAKLVLHESLTQQNQYGYLLLIFGVLVLLWAAPHHSKPLTTGELADHLQATGFLIYTGIIVVVGVYLGYYFLRRRLGSANGYVVLAAILGAVTIISSKAVSVFLLLTFVKGQGQFMSFLPYIFMAVLVISALALEVVKQAAITIYEASCFWPLFFAAYNLVAITFSLVLSQEIGDGLMIFIFRFSLGLFLLWQGSLYIHGPASGNFLISTAPLHFHAWLWRKDTPPSWTELVSESYNVLVDRFSVSKDERP